MTSHRHGSAMRPPKTKGELVRHMEQSHSSRQFVAQLWTVEALVDLHRSYHQRLATEGLEQA